jgi:hypothetical protein
MVVIQPRIVHFICTSKLTSKFNVKLGCHTHTVRRCDGTGETVDAFQSVKHACMYVCFVVIIIHVEVLK